MPIQVKTMRDIWDEKKERKKEGEVKGCKIFPPEIGKYYLEYLARKKAFLKTKDEIVKAFAEYEKKLGKAGFFKIYPAPFPKGTRVRPKPQAINPQL